MLVVSVDKQMDARLRLNQIRRQKMRKTGFTRKNLSQRFSDNQSRNSSVVTDLRQLITPPNVDTNDVKRRIGFLTKKRQLMRQRSAKSPSVVNKIQDKSKARVTISKGDDRIPKVMVRFTAIKDNSGSAKQNNIKAKTLNTINSKSLANRRVYESNRSINYMSSPPNYSLNDESVINRYLATEPQISDFMTPSTSTRVSNMTINAANQMNHSNNCNVLISNLNTTISQSDIIELFGEIGPLVSVRKIKPTVAFITYENESDGIKACQTYHNRLLDGIPMQCNILPDSQNPYSVRQQSYGIQSNRLLASQLRQINSTSAQPRKMTAAQAFANNRNIDEFDFDFQY